ncbi:MAG TPA: DAK2 domain-containing protein [Nocardioidaceae bacterium]|nr:DAK2 domain-containing protein [Nocardioidaceae bacterium]
MDEAVVRGLFARWRDACVVALGEAREEIDALNVFPVPDADTGTNVYLTMDSAARAADAADAAGAPLPLVITAFIDGALRGARGNSGVIVSQLLRACVPVLAGGAAITQDARDPAWSPRLATAFDVAARAAWDAVGDPVEGTILSVARAAAEGAASVHAGAPPGDVLRAATRAAAVALERTPDQLEQLRRAGVVDAGGRALTVLLDTTESVLTGRRRARPTMRSRPAIPIPLTDHELSPDGPSYEVMYLLDADVDAVTQLRKALAPLGDSLVVVGGDRLWNVHVHVDDVGAAIEAGIAAGRPHRVVVTHFAEQVAAAKPAPGGRVVLATAAGPGLAELFTEAGATVVTPSDGRRCSTADLLAALLTSDADEVVLLPNDPHVLAAADAAAQQARRRGFRVAVIPSRAQVQGLAALAVHEPGRGFDDDVVQMTAAAGHTRHGAVTVATHSAGTSAGPGKPGDVLGIVEGEVQLAGSDVTAVAEQVLHRLLGGGGELVTVVTGHDAPRGLGPRLVAVVASGHPEVDVLVHEGGQAGYPVLVAVE